jgi:hypothetical protein
MTTFKELFDRLDFWRNLANYQLERHIDVFISFYLKKVLEHKFSTEISDFIIPEFPINQNLVIKGGKNGQWSNNVDFAVLSKDLSEIYFIELKTDMSSKRSSQDELMKSCNGRNFHDFLVGVKNICLATKQYSKYATLISYLQDIGLITVPSELWNLDFEKSPYGYKKRVQEITIPENHIVIKSVFIQPRLSDPECSLPEISFEYFASVISDENDKVGSCFSEKLRAWSSRARSRTF